MTETINYKIETLMGAKAYFELPISLVITYLEDKGITITDQQITIVEKPYYHETISKDIVVKMAYIDGNLYQLEKAFSLTLMQEKDKFFILLNLIKFSNSLN